MNSRARFVGFAMLLAGCADGTRVEPIDSPAATQSGQSADPVLGLDPVNQDLALAWVGGRSTTAEEGWHVYFARSTDAGETWTTPVRVSDRAGDVHPHGESSPRMVLAHGVIGIAWINSVPAPGRRWPGSNVRFSRSTDGGRSWSPAITLNDDTASGVPRGHLFHGAAVQGDSAIVVAWMDERGMTGGVAVAAENTAAESHKGHHQETMEEPDATVYLARSPNLGRTWDRNRPLWGAACPCCRVTLARAPVGGIVAAWRKHFPGNIRDIVVSPVAESPHETRVHADDWEYPGCPHTGPGAAIDAGGRLHVTWFNGKPGSAGVYYARSDSSAEFTEPVALVSGRTLQTAHPRVAALPDSGVVIVWDVSEDGPPAVHLARLSRDGDPGPSVKVKGSTGADHPEVLALPDGRVIVAWTERGETAQRLRLARIDFD